MPQERERALDAFMDIDSLSVGFVQARKVPQTPNDFHDAVRGQFVVPADLFKNVQHSVELLVRRRSYKLSNSLDGAIHDVVVAVDRAHRRVDFMRDTSHETA